MNIEIYRGYCLSLNGVEEKMPFDNITLVFYIKGKMFSLANIETFERINLKCKPEDVLLLREKYEDVIPGYHMNKKHWNTILPNGEITDSQIKQWTKDSYNLVVAGLPKKIQRKLIETFKTTSD